MIRALRIALPLALLSTQALAAPGDGDLPRRAWLGASLEAVDGGIRVRDVFPRSSAEAGGLKRGDVLKARDGNPIGSLPQFIRSLKTARTGTKVAFEAEREGEKVQLAFPLVQWPREEETDAYKVEYGDVTSKAGRLRTITLVPKAIQGSRAPAVLIMQGLSAVTLDNMPPNLPIDQPVGMAVYRTIAAAMAEAGFVVTRVDKAGCGDSEGEATQLDFHGERDGYQNALKALRARSDVDPERIILFGHSMGGIMAPLVAQEDPVRGIAVYGISLKNWFEYLLENDRRQRQLAGVDLAVIDRGSRLLERFHHEFLVNKRIPTEITADRPELAAAVAEMGVNGDLVFGRHHTFFHQLADVNVAEAWSKVNAHVLALWGEAEIVTSRQDHEDLAAYIDARSPGKGRFQLVPESDHGFGRHKTGKEAIQAGNVPATFNPAIIGVLKDWSLKISH